MKVALSARVSTKDQQTIPAQLAALRQECGRQKWKVVPEASEKESGRKNRREARKQILEATSKGK